MAVAVDRPTEACDLKLKVTQGPRIGKEPDGFRNYKDSERVDLVREHYRQMRTYQTVDFVQRMQKKWLSFDHGKLTIEEAFRALESFVDSADPDTPLPNRAHGFQTAEGLRAAGHPEWLVFTGFVHDLGKIMFLWGADEDGQASGGKQFALGGDTWPVGCRIANEVVYPEFNVLSPDMQDTRYNTALGPYPAGCGFDAMNFTWGHDEYMYQFLKHNRIDLPEVALKIVRYHSFYPWHTGGGYKQFESSADRDLLPHIHEFNQYDLYTKADQPPDEETLWVYYRGLIDKFAPGKLEW